MHRSLSALSLLLALAASPVSATSPAALSVRQLADQAHVIVVGHATTRQVVWIGRDLITVVTVAVGDSLKGATGTTLTVALPGGIDRQRKIPIEVLYVGAPRIAGDEEVLLFLERGNPRHPGTYVISGFAQGKLSIVTDPSGVKWVSRASTMSPHEPQVATGLKRLSDVREEIRLYLEGGTQ